MKELITQLIDTFNFSLFDIFIKLERLSWYLIIYKEAIHLVFFVCLLAIVISLFINEIINIIYKIFNLIILSILAVLLWLIFSEVLFIFIVYILAFIGAIMLFLSVILMFQISALYRFTASKKNNPKNINSFEVRMKKIFLNKKTSNTINLSFFGLFYAINLEKIFSILIDCIKRADDYFNSILTPKYTCHNLFIDNKFAMYELVFWDGFTTSFWSGNGLGILLSLSIMWFTILIYIFIVWKYYVRDYAYSILREANISSDELFVFVLLFLMVVLNIQTMDSVNIVYHFVCFVVLFILVIKLNKLQSLVNMLLKMKLGVILIKEYFSCFFVGGASSYVAETYGGWGNFNDMFYIIYQSLYYWLLMSCNLTFAFLSQTYGFDLSLWFFVLPEFNDLRLTSETSAVKGLTADDLEYLKKTPNHFLRNEKNLRSLSPLWVMEKNTPRYIPNILGLIQPTQHLYKNWQVAGIVERSNIIPARVYDHPDLEINKQAIGQRIIATNNALVLQSSALPQPILTSTATPVSLQSGYSGRPGDVINENHPGPAVSSKQRATIEQERSIPQVVEVYESKDEKLIALDSNVIIALKKGRVIPGTSYILKEAPFNNVAAVEFFKKNFPVQSMKANIEYMNKLPFDVQFRVSNIIENYVKSTFNNSSMDVKEQKIFLLLDDFYQVSFKLLTLSELLNNPNCELNKNLALKMQVLNRIEVEIALLQLDTNFKMQMLAKLFNEIKTTNCPGVTYRSPYTDSVSLSEFGKNHREPINITKGCISTPLKSHNKYRMLWPNFRSQYLFEYDKPYASPQDYENMLKPLIIKCYGAGAVGKEKLNIFFNNKFRNFTDSVYAQNIYSERVETIDAWRARCGGALWRYVATHSNLLGFEWIIIDEGFSKHIFSNYPLFYKQFLMRAKTDFYNEFDLLSKSCKFVPSELKSEIDGTFDRLEMLYNSTEAIPTTSATPIINNLQGVGGVRGIQSSVPLASLSSVPPRSSAAVIPSATEVASNTLPRLNVPTLVAIPTVANVTASSNSGVVRATPSTY